MITTTRSCNIASGHVIQLQEVEEPQEERNEEVTKDCFINKVVSEESDDNEEDDDETTTDGIHECDGGISSASSSASSIMTECLPLEKAKALYGTILDFLLDQESLYRKINTFKRKFIASSVSDLYHTKVIRLT